MVHHLWILEVDGNRLVAVASLYPDQSEQPRSCSRWRSRSTSARLPESRHPIHHTSKESAMHPARNLATTSTLALLLALAGCTGADRDARAEPGTSPAGDPDGR